MRTVVFEDKGHRAAAPVPGQFRFLSPQCPTDRINLSSLHKDVDKKECFLYVYNINRDMWNPKTKPIELIDAENRPLMGRGQG